jgi:acetyl esterase/lipase
MVLYAGEHDRLQVAQVPWSCTARWRMPVDAWQRVMAAYYPGGGWVRLDTETMDALARRKAQRGDHNFDATIRGLLG